MFEAPKSGSPTAVLLVVTGSRFPAEVGEVAALLDTPSYLLEDTTLLLFRSRAKGSILSEEGNKLYPTHHEWGVN